MGLFTGMLSLLSFFPFLVFSSFLLFFFSSFLLFFFFHLTPFLFRRLLSTNPEAAKKVVLSQKPLISDASLRLEPALLDDLVSHISTLASVYHKPPGLFFSLFLLPSFFFFFFFSQSFTQFFPSKNQQTKIKTKYKPTTK